MPAGALPGWLRERSWLIWPVGAVLWTVSLCLAVAPLDEGAGTSLWSPSIARVGAAAATWFPIVLVARRIGGPVPLVAAFAGGCLLVALVFPRGWVLSAEAVAAGVSYGLLGMVMTRPAAGLLALREALVALVFGAAGAVAVTGYDVGLRPYRFRLAVLALTLLAALAVAWQLSLGFRSLGRRGAALIIGAVVVLVVTVVYVQLVRQGGSPGVVGSLTATKGTLRQWIGAAPRPVEALVGFPALIWGAAVRNRRRQGWWMSAFGSLAAAGIATSLAQPSVALREATESTVYSMLIGCCLGLALVGLDRLLGGPGHGASPAGGVEPERAEPGRTSSLL